MAVVESIHIQFHERIRLGLVSGSDLLAAAGWGRKYTRLRAWSE